jgi:hypothetical protein
MHKALPFLLIAACFFSGCKSSNTSASSAKASDSNDPVEKKLQELAGSGATSCGHLKSQAADQMDAAGKCATQAAQQKHAFYVIYDLPGMTVAVAGNAEGKLFTAQAQGGGSGLVTGACPSELRVAPSGRVTCYAPGTFPMGAGAGSHSTMPPMGGASPHKGSQLPPGHPNPHSAQDQKPPAKQL